MNILEKIQKKIKVFYDREKELKDLDSYLKKLENKMPKHILIMGPRRMGKTHLIQKFLYESRKIAIPVYLDLFFILSPKQLAEKIMYQFFENYSYITKKRFKFIWETLKGNVNALFDAIKEIEFEFGIKDEKFFAVKFGFQDSEQIDSFVRVLDKLEEICDRKNLRIIIALDEFQQIANWKDWQAFVGALRSNLQYYENIMFIISGSKTTFIKEGILQQSKPFWKQLITYEIKPFRKEVVEKILWENGLDPKLNEKFNRMLKNIPDYVMKMVELLKDKGDFESVYIQLLENEQYFFESVIEKLNDKEKRILGLLSKGPKSYSEIESVVKRPEYSLEKLISADLIFKNNEKKYEIVDPLLKEYVSNFA